MPFISQDWRGPGEDWVKSEDGWEIRKVSSSQDMTTMWIIRCHDSSACIYYYRSVTVTEARRRKEKGLNDAEPRPKETVLMIRRTLL